MVEGVSDHYEPKGVRFFDRASGRHMLLVQDPGSGFDGWLCWRHPDGQWVTLRLATSEDREAVMALVRKALP